MARDLTPIVKRSRREGVALHNKAHKVMMKRKGSPGQKPGARITKASQYALQLREKQKVKRIFGLLERQFRNVVQKAERSSGVTGEVLLQMLELRLDNVVYRLHWANSRRAARQLVSHGHIELNGRRVDIPSIQVKPGDKITVRSKSQKSPYFQNLPDDQPEAQLSWLSIGKKELSAEVTGSPTREEMEPEIEEALIIEFYSR